MVSFLLSTECLSLKKRLIQPSLRRLILIPTPIRSLVLLLDTILVTIVGTELNAKFRESLSLLS